MGAWQTWSMQRDTPSYHGYRFPPEIISHAVWLYHRFGVSFRDVEDLLAQRGITVSYEAIRLWCLTFGSAYARRLRRRQGRLGDIWHLDEVFVAIQGRRYYLWRAVDQDGDVIDILVQSRRDCRAATRFFRKLLKGQECTPGWLVTDKLTSYRAAHRAVSVSNSLSGRHWELDQVPAVGDPTDIVQFGTGHHVSANEGRRRVALQRRVAAYLVVVDLEVAKFSFKIAGIPEQPYGRDILAASFRSGAPRTSGTGAHEARS